MRFRNLRIAFSATCGIACVLLIVLWVRSYRYMDEFTTHAFGLQEIGLASIWGHMSLGVLGPHPKISYNDGYWGLKTWDFKSARFQNHVTLINGRYHFTPFNGRFVWLSIDTWEVWIPHWLLVLLSATFATFPWIHKLKWRFSLRTLLIATTLTAVVLGLAVWALRNYGHTERHV